MDSKQELLAKRYGQKPKLDAKKFRPLAIAAVVLMSISALAISAMNYNPAQFKDIGFRVVSEWQTEIEFELTKPKEATAICSFEALNNSFLAVGYKEIEFGPSDFETNRHTVSLNTTELAVTGLVKDCSLR